MIFQQKEQKDVKYQHLCRPDFYRYYYIEYPWLCQGIFHACSGKKDPFPKLGNGSCKG